MEYVHTVSYSILVNGEPKGLITPTRGIRQEDPLSPFLFLLCTEGLHGLITKAARAKEINSFSLCKRGPKLTHLFFANDNLLFCKANPQECGNVFKILSEYEAVSGQKSIEKTSLFFSESTKEDMRQEIKRVLGVQEIKFYEKYLGLPSLVRRGKKASFSYIKERVWRKLQGWEGKLLSQIGREVLIKAIVQAIPTYTMGCFKMSSGLCHDIEAIIKKKKNLGAAGSRRKIHWIKWSMLTKSKLARGMGFRDLALFNDSLLAKQVWRLLHNKDTLFYRIFKARFFPHCSFMETKESASASYAWKSILKGREVIKMGSRFRVGNGKNIKIWQHHWLPIKHPPLVTSPIIESMEDATVDCLIDEDTRKWDVEMVDGILVPAEAALVKKIPLARSPTEYSLFWPFTANGQYNCKSGYRFLKELEAGAVEESQPDLARQLWKSIWSLEVLNKYKNMM